MGVCGEGGGGLRPTHLGGLVGRNHQTAEDTKHNYSPGEDDAKNALEVTVSLVLLLKIVDDGLDLADLKRAVLSGRDV